MRVEKKKKKQVFCYIYKSDSGCVCAVFAAYFLFFFFLSMFSYSFYFEMGISNAILYMSGVWCQEWKEWEDDTLRSEISICKWIFGDNEEIILLE